MGDQYQKMNLNHSLANNKFNLKIPLVKERYFFIFFS